MNLDPKLKEILDSLKPSEEAPVEEMTPKKARRTWKAEIAGNKIAVSGAGGVGGLDNDISITAIDPLVDGGLMALI